MIKASQPLVSLNKAGYLHPRSLTARPWKRVVGSKTILSYWEGSLSEAMLNFGGGNPSFVSGYGYVLTYVIGRGPSPPDLQTQVHHHDVIPAKKPRTTSLPSGTSSKENQPLYKSSPGDSSRDLDWSPNVHRPPTTQPLKGSRLTEASH